MRKLSLDEEFENVQKLYGNYYTEQMFVDINGYKEVRKMNSYKVVLEELLSLEPIQDEEWN